MDAVSNTCPICFSKTNTSGHCLSCLWEDIQEYREKTKNINIGEY